MANRKYLSIEDANLGSSTFTTRKNRDYSDIDLTLATSPGPAGVNLTGDVYKKTGAEAVKQALKTLLLCNPFKKPFEPNFGVGLREMLFELNDGHSQHRIRIMIEQKIKMYEPRAELKVLNIIPNVDSYEVRVELVVQIVNTSETFQFTTTLNRLR